MNPPPEASDPFNLQRFVEAQSDNYRLALSELRAGQKRGHWIWYILPQMRGLGTSSMSTSYGIGSLAEAKALLAHPVLGARLAECVAAVSVHKGLRADRIFGSLDAMKFKSCLTLFAAAAGSESIYSQALGHFFAGRQDQRTLELLAQSRGEPT